MRTMVKQTTYVILHNIRSAHNVGSIFRTADGAGISKIFLTGYTPAPRDRFGRTVSEIAKTSLGAADIVAWESYADVRLLIQKLQAEGVRVIAVEQTPKSTDYTQFKLDAPAAYIFGNEVDGVPKEICEVADAVIEIPMHGTKESLNVSVAAGIILFHR